MHAMRQQRNVRTKGLRDESKSDLQECEALACRINKYSVKQGKTYAPGKQVSCSSARSLTLRENKKTTKLMLKPLKANSSNV